jgi:aminobenzoyl-glutamate utilization protein A
VNPKLAMDRILKKIEPQLIADRRDFHQYAEAGWTEFRTSSLIARRLTELGLDVRVGPDVVAADARMGLPEEEALASHWRRAEAQGGDPVFLEQVRGGFTGAVGTVGSGDGPVIGLRFDIDALDLQESDEPSHRPAAEGFASVNDGVSHACGHDGHAAIGLAVAEVLVRLQDAIKGTVRLIFQPAEEGVRGAESMVAAGVVDDVDAMLALHVYSGWPTGQLTPGQSGFLATRKFDAWFEGQAAHAGGGPHRGKNAMLAAATAVLNLHAIPRHREGTSRVNVGRLNAGMGRNVICPNAHLVIETRGETSAIDAMMYERAVRILEGAAAMYDCALTLREMGRAESAASDAALADRVADVATGLKGYALRTPERSGGSEDYTVMMRRVQAGGGLATNIGFGADLGGFGHHTPRFDFDEGALRMAASLLSHVTLDLLLRPIQPAD